MWTTGNHPCSLQVLHQNILKILTTSTNAREDEKVIFHITEKQELTAKHHRQGAMLEQ